MRLFRNKKSELLYRVDDVGASWVKLTCLSTKIQYKIAHKAFIENYREVEEVEEVDES